MKAIVYTSETGHTAHYAQLLAQKTGLPAMTLAQARKKLCLQDEVFYLGWLMAGSTKGFRAAKKLFVIPGAASVGMVAEANGSLWEKAKAGDGTVDGTRIFYLQGGYDGTKLRGVYRMMMRTMEKRVGGRLRAKKDRTAEEDAMLALLCGGDCVREENLEEILNWIGQGY